MNISVKTYYTTSGSVTNSAAVVLADIANAIFTGTGGFTGEGFNSSTTIPGGYGTGSGLINKTNNSNPKAYLNYLFFDRNFNYAGAGYWQVEGSGARTLSKTTPTFDQPGYLFIYLTYENTTGYPVSFDDFTYTHNTTRVLASNSYYPFGLLSGQSWVRPENPLNRQLYNAGNERNEVSGYDETFYRLYDPALGRFMGVDPLAAIDPRRSPYAYAMANPLKYNDPLGNLTLYVPNWLLEVLSEWYNNGGNVGTGGGGGGGGVGGGGDGGGFSIMGGSHGGSYHSDGTAEYFNSAQDVVSWAQENGYGDLIEPITRRKYAYEEYGGNTHTPGQGGHNVYYDVVVGYNIVEPMNPLPSVITIDGHGQGDGILPIGDGGFLFRNENEAFDYMYSTSLNNSSGEIRELSGWITTMGILVMPYNRNGTNDSKNDYYKLKGNSDGSKSVVFGGVFAPKILGHVHTHPYDYDTGPTLPFSGTQGDFAMYDFISSPIFTIGPNNITMGIRIDGQPQRNVVGSKSGGIFSGSIYDWLK